jgi:iron-sulfur cluster assembly protein
MATEITDEKNLLGIKPNVDDTGAPKTSRIHLTERAAKKIRALLEKDGVSPEVGGLRVGVQGGGCSGLSYAMRLDTQARDRDKIFEEFGAKLFVDPKSFLYLNGTTLEYEETLMRQGFVFQNPNAARSCGCGSSFTA